MSRCIATFLIVVSSALVSACGGGGGGGPAPLPDLAGTYEFASFTAFNLPGGGGPLVTCRRGLWIRDAVSGEIEGAGTQSVNGTPGSTDVDSLSALLPGSIFRSWWTSVDEARADEGCTNAARSLAIVASAYEGKVPHFELAWRKGVPDLSALPAEHHFLRLRWNSTDNAMSVALGGDIPLHANENPNGQHVAALGVNTDGALSSSTLGVSGGVQPNGEISFAFPVPQFRAEGDMAIGSCHVGSAQDLEFFVREADGPVDMAATWHVFSLARTPLGFSMMRGLLALDAAGGGTLTTTYLTLEGTSLPLPDPIPVTYTSGATGFLRLTLSDSYQGAVTPTGDFAVLVGGIAPGDVAAVVFLMRAVP